MTIAEASRKYDLSADTLRYYERVGIIPRVPRTKSGIRDYDEASCGWIELTSACAPPECRSRPSFNTPPFSSRGRRRWRSGRPCWRNSAAC